jgi:hypothetical protein
MVTAIYHPVQPLCPRDASGDRAALKALLSTLEIKEVLIHADASHIPPVVFKSSLRSAATGTFLW